MEQTDPLQLLLIEDNPGDARYIEELLREATELSLRVDHDAGPVRTNGSDEQATPTLLHETRLDDGLERLASERIDAILLDLDLPDSDGIETLATLLDHTDVPVVVLTGQSARQVGTSALRTGADEYLVKDEINGDLLVRSLYHAIERREHERELKRYEVLTEESADVNAILDSSGTFQYVTPSVSSVLGYDPEEILGEDAESYVHPEDREQVLEAIRTVLEACEAPSVEFRFQHADDSWVILEAHARNLRDDPLVEGIVVYTRDVTERVEREEQLARQRHQLGALNDLNAVVREINEALIEQSTREEVEQQVLDRLTDSDSYLFAWIGTVDRRTQEVSVRAEAGVEGYLDDLTISVDADCPGGTGPTARAIRTGEVRVVNDVETDPDYEPWRDRAQEYEYRSSAAIPIEYQGTLYGVLNLYADRPNAFEGEERAVVGQLGKTVGHAINAIERKRVLVGDEVLEVEFTAQQYVESRGVSPMEGRITILRAVPIGGGRYVAYGTVTEPALDTLDELCERVDHWEDVSIGSASGDEYRFELDLSRPPVISMIAEQGGRLNRAVIEDGAFHLVVHLPPGSDVRRFTGSVQNALPGARLIAQRQTEPESKSIPANVGVVEEKMTVRQRNVLEAAYFAGFFEWPREATGEEIAETLDVSAPTFHQHRRKGERKLLESVFEGKDADE
jgi:PAS domain S-box-containing protein